MNKKLSRKAIIIIVALIIVSSITVYALNDNIFFRVGQAFKGNQQTSSQDKIIMQNNVIQIPRNEINKIAEQYKQTGDLNGEQKAIKHFLKYEVLYQQSLQKGYSISDDEVWAHLNKEKEMARNSSNYSDFKDFLKGTGMTEDEYWNSQFEIRKKELVIQKYFDQIMKDFVKGKKTAEWTSDERKQWRDNVEKTVDNLIKEKNITYVIKD